MTLYKLICLKSSSKVLKGMNVEVISLGKPSSDEIKKAVEHKYQIKIGSLSISKENWSYERIS